MRTAPIWLAILTLLPVSRAAAQPTCTDAPAMDRYCGVSLHDGFGGPNDFGDQCLSPNDDGSSTEIDITPAFPAGLRFFGRTHNRMWVNTNGNITFGGSLGTYTPRAFPVAEQPMIAPFWADVDIRGDGPGDACAVEGWSGSDWATCELEENDKNGVYWHLEPGRIVVTWDRVGYFACRDDRQMSFQLILTGAEGCGGADFDVEFRFAQCEWNTGAASGGTNGFSTISEPVRACTTDDECSDFGFPGFPGNVTCEGQCWDGVPGQSGFDAGNSTDFVEIGGSRTHDIHRVLCEESNVELPGIWQFQIRNGSVLCPGAGTACETGSPGVCAEGREQCVGDGTECQPIIEASDERCDALDNDCDGMIDDGDALCGPLAVCDHGTCIETCFEGGCSEGFVCEASSMRCVESGCEDVTCEVGERCSAGACVDACSGVVCPGSLACVAGRCLDLCSMLECDDCTACVDGACVARCDATSCAEGETCGEDGVCVERACASVSCSGGTMCRGGTCVDACEGAVCPRGESCEDGRCVTTRVEVDAGPPEAPDGGPPPVAMPDAGPAIPAPGALDGGVAECRGPACAGGDRPRTCSGCSTPGPREGAAPAALGALALLALLITRRRR
jgi:hypothetical protein